MEIYYRKKLKKNESICGEICLNSAIFDEISSAN